MTTTLPEYYTWTQVPAHHRTKKQWLKKHRRLKKGATAVGTITLVFDKPRSRPKNVPTVSPEECERIRKKLMRLGFDASDLSDLHRLDRAGQLSVINLFAVEDTEEITCFAEPEARKLLEYMVWDGSHADHYITEATTNGQRERATWKTEVSTPSLRDHLAGERYFGTKKGDATMQVTVDCDRHSGKISGEEHVKKVLKVGKVINAEFPAYRFAPEINATNGSVKFFGWLPDFTATASAAQRAELVRGALQEKLPEYDFSGLEIFPSTSPQIFAPLRADKIMVVGDGILRKCRQYRMGTVNGQRRRQYHDAYSCADYLNWVYFEDTPFNAQVFEEQLRLAVTRCPDEPQEGSSNTAARIKSGPKTAPSGSGMGSIGRLKGRCATALVNFWSELATPDDDTLGKYLIVTLRVLKHEGLDRDEAVDWIEGRLKGLRYTGFSDRLAHDFGEIERVVGYAVGAVWGGNGYQKDPDLSDTKLQATVNAWSRKGFFLHDPSTWHKHSQAVAPAYKLVWSPALLALIPDLADLANAGHDQARNLLETVLCFVQGHNELSESMVGVLLEQCGIKGRSTQKQHDVRKFLVTSGLLVKQRNYYNDKVTGYRHGNFYICGLAVEFQEEVAQPQHTHTVSIYLSLYAASEGDDTNESFNIVVERRQLACDRHYQDRIRRLRQVVTMAA